MASLRGFNALWQSTHVDPNDDTTITSALAVIGQDPYVTIYICSDEDATFDVEAGLNPTGVEAGRNAIDDSDSPDGGLKWFKYTGSTALAVSGGSRAAFDLSPFGPQYVRIVRTDNGSAGNVTAAVTSYGPN